MTLGKKLEVISEIRSGKSQRSAADIFGVSKSTVGDIWKDRDKIEAHVNASTNPSVVKKRCIVRSDVL